MEFDPVRQAQGKLKEVLNKFQHEWANDLSDISEKDFCWTTKEGVKIFFADMSDSHLENCIKLSRRRGIAHPILEYEYARRNRNNIKIK